jgi:hypothetical protein
MKKEQFQELLAENESTYLDWKKDFPLGLLQGKKHNDWNTGRAKVLKSLISLANSHGSDNAYLVYGVENLGASRNVTGISKSFDDADFQQWAENTFDPPPTFSYSELQWDALIQVGIFQIERTPDYPHVVTTNLGSILFEGQVWFRRGSKNTVALYQDLKKIFVGETAFKISKLNDPVLQKVTEHYKGMGKECVLPRFSDKDSYLARGYELATYPGTRREVWVGAVGDKYEHILFLKPTKK